MKGLGVIAVNPELCDGATTVVRIHADGQDHEVQYYDLASQTRYDERLTRLQNIATRLRDIERKLRAEAAAVPPGKVEPR